MTCKGLSHAQTCQWLPSEHRNFSVSLGLPPFARRYFGNRFCFLLLRLLKRFNSSGCLNSAFLLLLSALVSAVQEPPALRAIVAFSAAATLLYTPVLKRMTFIKNLAVAAVIALTPLTGALALGQVSIYTVRSVHNIVVPNKCVSVNTL